MPSDDPERLIKMLARFFRQFKDVKFDQSFLSRGFDELMPVSLTEGEHF
jgi:chorismate mutase